MTRRTGELLFDKLRPTPVEEGRIQAPPPQPVSEPVRRPQQVPPPTGTGRQTGLDVPDSDEKVRIDGPRLTLSLSSTAAGAWVFVSLVCLGLVFYAGHSWGHSRGRQLGFKEGRESYSDNVSDEISQARAGAPASGVVDGLLRDAPNPSALTGSTVETPKSTTPGRSQPGQPNSPAPAVAWVEGHNYIVVQEFDAGAEVEAEQARDYLLREEVPTAVVRTRSGRLRLVSVEGFNFKEATQRRRADALKQRIADAGERYFASGGRYKLQGYYAAYKGSW